jgi:hypothetical protein
MRSNGRSTWRHVEPKIGKALGEEHVLTRMEVERLEAIRHGNADVLERVYAPEYTAVFSRTPGAVVSKVQELALQRLEAGRLQLCELSDMSIRIYGNVGLVTGLASVQDVLPGNKRNLHSRHARVSQYTHLWVKRDGAWQLVHRHVHRLQASEGPRFFGDYATVEATRPREQYGSNGNGRHAPDAALTREIERTRR